jgi:glucosamine 6-phosphate synthetase-like amidotransferase/phosphosugar isomerase protein
MSSSHQPTPLIAWDDMLIQPTLWRQLLQRYHTEMLGLPSWHLTHGAPWVIGVGEGSSFNAFRLAQYQWHRWHPKLRVTSLRPWELQTQLTLWEPRQLEQGLWLPISQSARTASLREAWQQLSRSRRNPLLPLGGILLTNGQDEDIASFHASPYKGCSHTWHLQAGTEPAIAATKTFTGTLLSLWLLGLHQARLGDDWPKQRFAVIEDRLLALADAVEAWLPRQAHPDVGTLALVEALAGVVEYHPTVILLSNGPLVWGLAEAALKLTETTRQPVLYHHSENFKHGPKAMMSGHPTRQEAPCMVYVVPHTLPEAERLFSDAAQHFSEVEALKGQGAAYPKRLWLRFANSAPLPAAYATEPCMILPAVGKTREALLLMIVAFQVLGYHIAKQLHLQADGLSKAVE